MAAKQVATALKVGGVIAVILVSIVACAVTQGVGGDNSTLVEGPTAEEAQATSAQLAAASAAQGGICYGWKLEDGTTTPVSQGSNLGPTTPVESDPAKCAQYLEIVVEVDYAPESSESSDYAYVSLNDVTTAGSVPAAVSTNLSRFGLDDNAFINDPGFSTSRAALALPLLAAEWKVAPAAPAAAAPAAGTPPTLASPGNDFLRDRWGFLAGAGALLLGGLLLVVIGLFERRHSRESAVAKPHPRAART